MTDMTPAKPSRSRRPHHWRRDLIELAALFTAVAVADAVANLIGHQPDGPYLLIASAGALAVTAGFHTWWARRHGHAPPPGGTVPDTTVPSGTVPVPAGIGVPPPQHAAAPGTGGDAGTVVPGPPSGLTYEPADESSSGTDKAARPVPPAEDTVLWRMRATVRDAPGSLAALCLALARQRVDILTLQTHPLARGTVDEFLLRAPGSLRAQQLTRSVSAAGGGSVWIERADAHDLVDAPTRVLGLATRTALDAAELPLALRQLLGRCTIRSLPPLPATGGAAEDSVPAEGVLEETVMRLRDPSGGTLTVERPRLPFTPTEFARARALVELDARLGPRLPRGEHVLTLPEGDEITVRRADRGALDAARAMHARCSERTLSRRYHGPVRDADRYLDHLLSPRFGRTLAAWTGSGQLVALGHLLWDGDETEVALLVEDEWQRRGIGSELLRRLVALAAEAGCAHVYAVARASDTGMVRAMRALGLPLDYQVEEGTLVVTARLDAAPVHSLPPYKQAGH